jgi:hypothetical protein
VYHIFINIYGRSQLKRINHEKLEEIENVLAEQAVRLGVITDSGSLFHYHYMLPSDYSESAYASIESALSFQNRLKEYSSDLFGYNLILLKDNANNPEQWQRLFYLPVKDDSIWISKDITDTFSEWVEVQAHSELDRVTAFKPQSEIIEELKYQFLTQSRLKNFIEQALGSINGGVSFVLNYIGPAGYGKRNSIEQFLKKQHLPAHIEYLWLTPYASAYEPYEGFKEALSDRFLQYLSDSDTMEAAFHNRLSGIIYALRRGVKEALLADSLNKDLQILYTVYLKQYAAELRRSKAAPIIVIEAIEQFPAPTQDLLLTIFESCRQEKILVLTISQTPYHKLFNMEVHNCEATPIEARLAAAMHDKIDNAKRLEKANPYALMLHQWHKMKNIPDYHSDFTLPSTLRWFVKRLDDFSCRMLYTICLCDGMLPVEPLIEEMTTSGPDRIAFVQRIKTFGDLRLIRGDMHPQPAFGDLKLILTDILEKQREGILKDVARCAYNISKKGYYINLHYLFSLLEEAQLVTEALDVLYRYLSGQLNSRIPIAGFLNRHNFFKNQVLSYEQQKDYNFIMYAIKLRHELLQNAGAFHEVSAIPPMKEKEDNLYAVFFALEERRLFNATGDISNPNFLIKNILFAFQKLENPYGEALASLEMANAFLRSGQFRQAFDYCEIANHLCEQQNFIYGILLGLSIESACALGYGNLSLAYRNAEKGIKTAERAAMREKELYFRFIKARVQYECGHYSEALLSLEQSTQIALLYNFTEALPIITGWKGRCLAYIEEFEEAERILQGTEHPEALLYRAELYYLQGRIDEARSVLALLKTRRPQRYFNLSEKENWSDSYMLVEGRLLPFFAEKDLLSLLISSFSYYIEGLSGQTEAALEGLASLYNFNKINADEPYSYLYPYYYSQLLTGNEQREERYMAQSRAGRLLNARASRFDNLKMQEGFLHKNYWHKQLGNVFRR